MKSAIGLGKTPLPNYADSIGVEVGNGIPLAFGCGQNCLRMTRKVAKKSRSSYSILKEYLTTGVAHAIVPVFFR